MAVPEQTPYIEYTANGVVTGFALGFNCESKDHLIVTLDGVEPPVGNWSLTDGEVVFTTAPSNDVLVVIQRNTPFSRTTDYQSYNNSFRPQSVNGDFDRVWRKLQELGVADWILSIRINDLRAYVERQDSVLRENIDNLKTYVDDRDDELRSYLMEEIRKQGVALDQLDDYYNYLMQRLAQIAVDKGWDASFVVDGNESQHQINSSLIRTVSVKSDLLGISNPKNNQVVYVLENKKRYIYNPNLTAVDNGVTVIDKWEMEVQEAYYASWFCPQSSIDNVNEPQTDTLNKAYRYATENGRAFVIDQPYYVESTTHNGLNSYPALSGNDTLHYAIRILSNSTLIFKKGIGKLKLVPNNSTHSRILCVFDVENYAIFDPECIGDKDTHLGTTGEMHYMIAFHASKNGYVRNPVCRNSWGDGFYFGYPEWVSIFNVDVDYPTNLVIDSPYLENSSRNGISLCGAENLTINNPVIDIVDRIAPMSGIDMEPEEDFVYSGKRMHLKNVKIHNLTVKNALNYGVMSFILGNREIDVSFTGTTTFSAKAPYYCSFPIWHSSSRGSALTEAQYTASGAINFEKVVMSDDQAQWLIVSPISFHSELGKVKLNISDLAHTKHKTGEVGFSFSNPTSVAASWSGGLSVGKITLNGVGALELRGSSTSPALKLRYIDLPIPSHLQVQYTSGVFQFETSVNIGGYARLSSKGWYNTYELINNTIFTPQINPDDGNSLQARIYDLGAVSNGRTMTYSLESGLTTQQIGDGLYVHCGKLIRFTSPLSTATCEFQSNGVRKLKSSFGNFTIY